MKTLILISSGNLPEFISEENAVRETWAAEILSGNFPNIDLYFYKEISSDIGEAVISQKNHVLYIPKKKGVENNAYYCFMQALRYFQENNEYDYVLKVSTGTYINIRLLEMLEKKLGEDNNRIYGTTLVSNPLSNYYIYVMGDFMLLPKSKYREILNNEDKGLFRNSHVQDDIGIAVTLVNNCNKNNINPLESIGQIETLYVKGSDNIIDKENALNKVCIRPMPVKGKIGEISSIIRNIHKQIQTIDIKLFKAPKIGGGTNVIITNSKLKQLYNMPFDSAVQYLRLNYYIYNRTYKNTNLQNISLSVGIDSNANNKPDIKDDLLNNTELKSQIWRSEIRELWESAFDRIYIIEKTENNKNLKCELRKACLEGCSNLFFYKGIKNLAFNKENNWNWNDIWQYECLKNARDNNLNRILVITENVIFNNNLNIIKEQLENLPDTDIIVFNRTDNFNDKTQINAVFFGCVNIKQDWLVNSYSLNKNAICKATGALVAKFCKVSECLLNLQLKVAVPEQNLMVSNDILGTRYVQAGIDIECYKTDLCDIEWSKFFDHIYCIHYLKYKDRKKKIEDELDRIGILNSGIFSWKYTWDSSIYDVLANSEMNKAVSKGYMKCGLAHYFCIKEAYELGYRHILIIEDDEVFLRNLKDIQEVLSNMPEDYDICLLDCACNDSVKYTDLVKSSVINKFFHSYTDSMLLCSCYAMSREGMFHKIRNEEKKLNTNDFYMPYRKCNIEPKRLNRYFSDTLIAIQNPQFNDSLNIRRTNKLNNLNNDNFLQYTKSTRPEILKFISDKKIKENKASLISNNLHKFAICAIAKNENRYIREWVEWHKNIGFNKIFLYDNNDIDGERFETVINDYIKSGFIQVINKRGIVKSITNEKTDHTVQGDAYYECYIKHRNEYDWIALIDIDEFIICDNIYFLTDNAFKDYDAVHIQWKLYGDNGQVYYSKKPVMKRFLCKENEEDDNHFKTILNCNKLKRTDIIFHAHGFNKLDGLNICNVLGEKYTGKSQHMDNCPIKDPKIYLAHFYTKSLEEFLDRKLGKTSAISGYNSQRNFSFEYLTSSERYGYFKSNKLTDEKKAYIKQRLKIYNNDIDDKIVVSLTSYKERLDKLSLVLNSLLSQTLTPYKICITLCNKDLRFMPEELKSFIKENNIEIITTDLDLKGHKKYYFLMQKYRDCCIVTVDDDIIYDKGLIESLYKSYLKHKDCVSARRVHLMRYNEKGFAYDYNSWPREYNKTVEPSFDLFATGGAGNLYPPDCLHITEKDLPYIQKCINADDIYLKYLEIQKNIKTVYVDNYFTMGIKQLKDEQTQKNALWKINTQNKNLNDKYLNIFHIYIK